MDKFYEEVEADSFRPLTGIMIFNKKIMKTPWRASRKMFPSPYGDYVS